MALTQYRHVFSQITDKRLRGCRRLRRLQVPRNAVLRFRSLWLAFAVSFMPLYPDAMRRSVGRKEASPAPARVAARGRPGSSAGCVRPAGVPHRAMGFACLVACAGACEIIDSDPGERWRGSSSISGDCIVITAGCDTISDQAFRDSNLKAITVEFSASALSLGNKFADKLTVTIIRMCQACDEAETCSGSREDACSCSTRSLVEGGGDVWGGENFKNKLILRIN